MGAILMSLWDLCLMRLFPRITNVNFLCSSISIMTTWLIKTFSEKFICISSKTSVSHITQWCKQSELTNRAYTTASPKKIYDTRTLSVASCNELWVSLAWVLAVSWQIAATKLLRHNEQYHKFQFYLLWKFFCFD